MMLFEYQNGKVGFWNNSQPDRKPFGNGRVGIWDVTESLLLYLQGEYLVMVQW